MATSPRAFARRAVAALAVVAVAALTTAASSEPSDEATPGILTLDDVGGAPDQNALDAATTARKVGEGTVYELDHRIETVETVETEGEDTVVTLASDVLFESDSAELSSAAVARVEDVVADAEQGSTVEIDGHTDSVDSDAHNQKLSEQRAQAVADVVADTRPDLKLKVHGYGESRLKVPESGDDIADDRAQNRRVEIRYTATTPGGSATETEATDVAPVDAPYVPGDEIRVEGVDESAVVAQETVRTPEEGGGGRVKIGVEELVVRGPLVRARFQLTPLDPVPGLGGDPRSWGIGVYEMTGDERHPLLVDRDSLTSYEPAGYSFLDLGSDPWKAKTVVDRPVVYEVYFPRPVDEDITSLDVSLVPSWPTFEDVPVRWDG